MSADLWLSPDIEDDCCGPAEAKFPVRSSSRWEGHSINLTYNLSPMLREAGFPMWKDFLGAPCSEAGGVFRKVADTLAADPERFKKLNPENGWGTYEQAVDIMYALAQMCATHPTHKLDGWL